MEMNSMIIEEICICGRKLQKMGWLFFNCLCCGKDYSLSRKIEFVKLDK